MTAIIDGNLAQSAMVARYKTRHFAIILSFAICVVIPSGWGGFYLKHHAQGQYQSEASFSVHHEDKLTAGELIGGLSALGASSSTKDMDIIFDYVFSRALLDKVHENIDLIDLWARHDSVDPLFSLNPQASPEEMLAYWKRMVTTNYARKEGIISIDVKAFHPTEARLILGEIISNAATLVEDLSKLSESDQITFATEQLTGAEERLRVARVALAQFRTRHQILDPEADVQSYMGVVNELERQLGEALIDFDMLGVEESHTRARQALLRIDVLRSRIEAEKEKIGLGRENLSGYSAILNDYESLAVENEFATQLYQAALLAYDQAQAQSRRQTRYLATHIAPTLAESPTRPRKLLIWATATGFLFMFWGLCILVTYALRDRR